MIRFLNRRQKMFIGIVCLMIYCMVGFPISNSIDVGATEPANISMERFQLPSYPISRSFRTAQVFLEMFEKTPPPAEETVKLSKKEKKKLVEQGVAQYKEGERAQAKKTLEQAKAV
ncbi:MAG: hypothetical protein U9N83_04585, partial [Thermodesulfobacteriota bacterium]|nr:hypothetical protein [Thermodesulfobacteriota bacterium]